MIAREGVLETEKQRNGVLKKEKWYRNMYLQKNSIVTLEKWMQQRGSDHLEATTCDPHQFQG